MVMKSLLIFTFNNGSEKRMRKRLFFAVFVGIALAWVGCSDGDTVTTPAEAPETFSFERGGESTVSVTGQITRQLLISDLTGLIRAISAEVLAGENLEQYDTPDKVLAWLTPLYEEGGGANPNRPLPILVEAGDTALQTVYADLNDANLQDKLAGNDSVTDHADWNGGAFVGWSTSNLVVNTQGDLGAPDTPERLVLALLRTFATQAATGATGSFPIDATAPLYLTADGLDLAQLTQAVLLSGVNFSQGVDDYLDDDVEGKGLLAANELDGDESYTSLEHHWDEGYGYFGGARDYGMYTDDEIAGEGGREAYRAGYFDSNADGAVDLSAEFNFSAAVDAAKRDRDSAEDARTDFTGDADLAWRTGRAIIAAAHDAGEEVDAAAVGVQRDIIVSSWEKVIAATAVHHINQVLLDMDSIGTGDYDFGDHAEHWSALKGFALAFQFNPRSPMSATEFAAIHAAIGDAPAGASPTSPTDEMNYRAQLLDARALIGDAYDFDEANLTAW